jgi:hypothetical protein
LQFLARCKSSAGSRDEYLRDIDARAILIAVTFSPSRRSFTGMTVSLCGRSVVGANSGDAAPEWLLRIALE